MQFEWALSEHHFAAPKGQEVPQAKEGHSCTGVHQGNQGDYAQIMLLSVWKIFYIGFWWVRWVKDVWLAMVFCFFPVGKQQTEQNWILTGFCDKALGLSVYNLAPC